MARRTVLWMSNCSDSCLEAGAIIVEETGLMNVNADTMIVALHFLLKLQLQTCVATLRRTREVTSNILSRISGVIWTIPINDEDKVIARTGRR
jgi:nucleoside-triphosphatase THEP1